MREQLRDLVPLPPAVFYDISWNVPMGRDLRNGRPFQSVAKLPDVSDLLIEEPFADVAMTWTKRGVELLIKFSGKFSENAFPRYRDGDSVELFFNTRASIESTQIHKFCHHFVFLPDGTGAEMTRLRADEERPIAEQLNCEVIQEGRSTLIGIDCTDAFLYGFEPRQFKNIGFAYRINKFQKEPQCFPISSRDVIIESHPNLWGTINLEQA